MPWVVCTLLVTLVFQHCFKALNWFIAVGCNKQLLSSAVYLKKIVLVITFTVTLLIKNKTKYEGIELMTLIDK